MQTTLQRSPSHHTIKLTSMANFPHDQSQGIHVYRLEGFKVLQIEVAIEHFRGQVANGAEFLVGRNVQPTRSTLVSHSQAQIGNHTLSIPLDQDVFRL